MNKWATFWKEGGSWAFGGFVEEADLNHEKLKCEQENGPDSFRAHLFVDDSVAAAQNKGTDRHNPMRDVL